MESTNSHSRRKFIATLATGATAAGLSLIPGPIKANINAESDVLNFDRAPKGGAELDKALKELGQKAHPVAYDVSQAIAWGFIWSNVYFMTNEATGTPGDQLGVMNVLRHHGMFYAMNDATISKYKLGEWFHVKDPLTNEPALKNPYYEPADGVFPLPGLAGIKGLQEKGAMFCVCDMARKVNAQFLAQKIGANADEVYADFVAGTLPGIEGAPSGVWVLGRLAENKIAYIDASVG